MRRLLLLVSPLVMADPCTDLCTRDGPAVCTKGSWTKPNGYCQNYLYIGSPVYKDYCYHSPANADICPSDGIGVKPEDVEDLLGNPNAPQRPTAGPHGGPIVEVWIEDNTFLFKYGQSGRRLLLDDLTHRDKAALTEYARIASFTEQNFLQGLMALTDVASFPVAEGIDKMAVHDGDRSIRVFCRHQPSLVQFASFFTGRDAVVDALETSCPDWGFRLCSMALTIHTELEARFE
jgi:hypothetical protein